MKYITPEWVWQCLNDPNKVIIYFEVIIFTNSMRDKIRQTVTNNNYFKKQPEIISLLQLNNSKRSQRGEVNFQKLVELKLQ